MKKPGIPKEELIDILEELPSPLRYEYHDFKNGLHEFHYGGRERTLRTVAEGIVRALTAPIERFLRWWRKWTDAKSATR